MSAPLVANIGEAISALAEAAPLLPEVLVRFPVFLLVVLAPWLVLRDTLHPSCVAKWLDRLLSFKMFICCGLLISQLAPLLLPKSRANDDLLPFWDIAQLDTMAIVEALSLVVLLFLQHKRSPKPAVSLSLVLPLSACTDLAMATVFQTAPYANSRLTHQLGAILKFVLLILHEAPKTTYLCSEYSQIVSREDVSGFWGQFLGLSRTSIINHGRRNDLSISDTADVPARLLSANMYAKFQTAWLKYHTKRYALFKTCMTINRLELVEALVAGLTASLLHAATPLLIENMISLSQSPASNIAVARDKYTLMWLIFAMFLLQAIFRGYSKRRLLSVQVSTQGTLAAALFNKVSSIPDRSLVRSAKVALITTSLPAAIDGIPTLYTAIMYLFEAAAYVALLWKTLGPIALTAAMIVIGCTSIGIRLGSNHASSTKQLISATAARSQTSSNLLGNLKNVKLLGLEAQLQLALTSLQKIELTKLRETFRAKSRQEIIVLSYMAISSLFCFSSHLISEQPNEQFSNLPLFFRSFAIIIELCFLMAKISNCWWVIPGSAEAYMEIQKFLKLPATKTTPASQQHQMQRHESLDETDAIRMRDVSIARVPGGRPLLSNVNLTISQGATAILTGSPEAGKSMLLNAIGGRNAVTQGEVAVSSQHFGYCGQSNWLQSRSVKDNIVGPTPFNASRYSITKTACLLNGEISLLPGADNCIIGSHGTVINHALQQRIALARAVYSGAPIVALDDPISAQTKDVGDEIISRLLGPQGVLRSSTVVIATSKPFRFTLVATTAFCITESGTIQPMGRDQLIAYGLRASKPITSDMDNIPQEKPPSKLPSLASVARQMSQTIRLDKRIKLGSSKAPLSLYLSNADRGLLICCFLLCILGCILEDLPKIMFRIWFGSNTSQPFSVVACAAVAILTGAMFTAFRHVIFIALGPRCSKAIFTNLLNSTLRAPLSSLHLSRLETLQSLFTEGIRVITFDLPFALFRVILFSSTTLVAWTTAISCIPQLIYALPIFLACVIASKSFFHRSYRQAQRLHTRCKEQLQVHFVETVAGAAHIDHLNWHVGYGTWSSEYIDASQSTLYFQEDLARWHQGVWHVIIAFFALIFAAASIYGTSSPYEAGFTMIMFLDLCKLVKVYMPSCVDLDIALSALDQIREFIATSPREADQQDCTLPAEWPMKGRLEFSESSIANGIEGASPVVRNFSLAAPAATKIVVQEAPSSRQSPFILSLLNRTQYTGSIKLDGVEINKVLPRTILSRITIMVDRPVVFPGTVRQNMLPHEFLQHGGDPELYTKTLKLILQKLSIWDVIQSQGGLLQLFEHIYMSPEQLQRFAFAQGLMRYMVHKTPLILIDGITNYVDNDSSLLMSRIISEIFKRRTVVMAAHSALTLERPYLNIAVEDGEATVTVRAAPRQVRT